MWVEVSVNVSISHEPMAVPANVLLLSDSSTQTIVVGRINPVDLSIQTAGCFDGNRLNQNFRIVGYV